MQRPCVWLSEQMSTRTMRVDAQLSKRAGPDEPQPEAEQEAGLLRFLQEVFATGHLSAAAFAEQLGDLSCITQAEWFQQGLPEGAESMTATYREKTEERRASADFRTLAAEVQRVLAVMGGGSGPARPGGSGGGSG